MALDRYKRDVALPRNGTLVPTLTGDWPTVSGEENLLDAVRRRIATTPGGLIHRESFGCGLLAYLEAPASGVTAARFSASIQSNIVQDPRVETVEVSVEEDATKPERVFVDVTVFPVGDDRALQVGTEIDLGA